MNKYKTEYPQIYKHDIQGPLEWSCLPVRRKNTQKFQMVGGNQSLKGAETGLKYENPADMYIYINDLTFTERNLKIYQTLYL